MSANPITVDPVAARAEVAAAARRVGALLRAARHPEAPALGDWNVTDVAVHLSHTIDAIGAMAKGGGALIDDIWGLSSLTGALVMGETTRDLPGLADRIEASVSAFLTCVEETPDADDHLRSWVVKGIDLPLATLTCHLLNDLIVHGRDIAVAEGAPWSIARPAAVASVCGFLFPAMGRLGRAMIHQEAAAGQRICMDVRVRGGCRVFLRFNDGDFSVDAAPWKSVDCHLSVEPAPFLLVAWNRIDQWGPIAKGQLLAWGRRPWMGLKLRSLLRNP